MSNKKSGLKKPIILKRMHLRPPSQNNIPLKKLNNVIKHNVIKLATIPLYREDVIFESNGEPYIPGDLRRVTIINKLNNLTNNCQTIAQCITQDHEIIIKTSDSVTDIIGHEAYNTVFFSLCSVINQEYRIKGILSLLKAKERPEERPEESVGMGNTNSIACQTDETRIETKTKRPRKRVRKIPVPYAVTSGEIKKLTVIPASCVPSELKCKSTNLTNLSELQCKSDTLPSFLGKIQSVRSESEVLPDLKLDLGNINEDSNDDAQTVSEFTCNSLPEIIHNPLSLVQNVEKHTQDRVQPLMNHRLMLSDGTEIFLRNKQEDMFHIATAENLQYLDEIDKKKLLLHQVHIDFKYCLSLRDEDGNLPIHVAVINEDIPLLKRQCAVLNIKKESVDIPTTNGLTALKLSLYCESAEATRVLLEHGADPLQEAREHSTGAHLAAETRGDHLAHILHHCTLHARDIITHHADELQTPGWEQKTDKDLSSILLNHVCSTFDKQGYTPLMLASKMGLYENTRLLAEHCPKSVHLTMPTSGNTALFLAVAAACTAAAEQGNKSKVVDHFQKTIEILLDAGADPAVDNNYGANVNVLLQEFNCAELSMLVANKITHNRFTDEDTSKNCDNFFLIKDGDNVSLKEKKRTAKNNKNDAEVTVKKEFETNDVTKLELNKDFNELLAKGYVKLFAEDSEVKTEKTTDTKPVITENILLKTPVKKIKILKQTISVTDIIKEAKMKSQGTVTKEVICHQTKRKSDLTDTRNPKLKKT